MACSYCYARRMYKRFKWNPEISFDENAFQSLMRVKEPSRVFVGSTMELFGDWVKREWMMDILSLCNAFKKHTFIFLTKQPQNLIKWSPFPDNCWVGVSATDKQMYERAIWELIDVRASVKFVSIEPLLDWKLTYAFKIDPKVIQWLIIGQQTPDSIKTNPKIEWLKEIVKAADNSQIPVFLKNNLWQYLFSSQQVVHSDPYWDGDTYELRQEFPKES